MASHDYHESLEGYDPRQVWHDGCGECERRGATVPYSVRHLDDSNMVRAWDRTQAWTSDDWSDLGSLSQAEMPLLRFLEDVNLMSRRLAVLGVDTSLSRRERVTP